MGDGGHGIHGCYHINLFSSLSFQGIRTVVVSPLLISNFAKLSLRKTKTDKKDALTIARFVLDHHEEISQFSISQDHQDLRDLSRERESLSHLISATKVEIKRVLRTTFPELCRERLMERFKAHGIGRYDWSRTSAHVDVGIEIMTIATPVRHCEESRSAG